MPQVILYIEDSESNAELVQAIGESAGYQVLLAYTGQEGIDLAEKRLPDLIICDYHLPYMNGHDVVVALRANDKTKAIPIMMLTADIYSYPDSLELGVDDYLNKPIRRNMFLNRVERILGSDKDSDDSPMPL
jgi:DNA-binding response OmpR family regulator